MNISKPLPGSIKVEYCDEEWEKIIDCEHISFHCHKFHEHGHLFQYFPLNAPSSPTMNPQDKMKDGFT
jgi:hypothetical protein